MEIKTRKDILAQATLETVIALICALILFLGCVKIFQWAGASFASRQQYYEGTRVQAGSSSPGTDDQDGSAPRLAVF